MSEEEIKKTSKTSEAKPKPSHNKTKRKKRRKRREDIVLIIILAISIITSAINGVQIVKRQMATRDRGKHVIARGASANANAVNSSGNAKSNENLWYPAKESSREYIDDYKLDYSMGVARIDEKLFEKLGCSSEEFDIAKNASPLSAEDFDIFKMSIDDIIDALNDNKPLRIYLDDCYFSGRNADNMYYDLCTDNGDCFTSRDITFRDNLLDVILVYGVDGKLSELTGTAKNNWSSQESKGECKLEYTYKLDTGDKLILSFIFNDRYSLCGIQCLYKE